MYNFTDLNKIITNVFVQNQNEMSLLIHLLINN